MQQVDEILALFSKPLSREQEVEIATYGCRSLWENISDADKAVFFSADAADTVYACEAHAISQLLIPLTERQSFLPSVEFKRLGCSGIFYEPVATRKFAYNGHNLVIVDCAVHRITFGNILNVALVLYQNKADVKAYMDVYTKRCDDEFLRRKSRIGTAVRGLPAAGDDDDEEDDDEARDVAAGDVNGVVQHILRASKEKRKHKQKEEAKKLRNKYDYEDEEDIEVGQQSILTEEDIRKDIEEEFCDFDDPQNVFAIKAIALNFFFTITKRAME